MHKFLIVPVLLALLSFPAGLALAQSAHATVQAGVASTAVRANAQAGASAEHRTVPGVVSSVQVDRFLMSGHRDNDAVTYNVLVNGSTVLMNGSTTMKLADLRPGTNVEVSGQLTMLTLTITADRVVVGGPSGAATSSAASGQPESSGTPQAPAPKKGLGGFFASLWHALFGWMHR